MLIFLHFFLWNLNNVFNSSSKIDLSISLGQKGIGNQMTEHAVINKPLYFVTSLCAVDVCFYKLVSTLFHYRYTGEFYCLKWEKICTYIFRPSVQGTVLRSYDILPKAAHKTDTSYPWVRGRMVAGAQLNAFLWATFHDVLYHTGILCSSALL